MAATIGHGAVVVIGLAVGLFAAAASILAGRSGTAGLAAVGRRAVYGAWILSAGRLRAMAVSLLNHDFSILYVARNNATTTRRSTRSSRCGRRSRAASCSGRSC